MKKELLVMEMAACGIILCLLGACNLSFGGSEAETPAPSPTEPSDSGISLPEPAAGTAILWTDGSYLVYVPAGEFLMGQDETSPADHSPQHTVTLDGFWIHQTEVTNRMYALCAAVGICTPPAAESGVPYWYTMPDRGSDPVVGVDWYQAATYCEWIKGRLPSEAEWEKAARGTEGDPYPWGEEEPTCDLLNFKDCFDPAEPKPVRSYLPGASFFELADTAGNVAEWVSDYYQEDFYSLSPASNPTGPTSGDSRVVRSSSYLTAEEELAIYLRAYLKPDKHSADLGFRCIVEEETVGDPPPPACEVQSMYVPPLDAPPTPVPFSVEVAYNAYCNTSGDGSEYGVVNLIFPGPATEWMYDITASYGTPIVKDDPSYPNMLFITNAAIGSTFQLTICPKFSPPPALPEIPDCPPGYSYDMSTKLCHFGHNPEHGFMCWAPLAVEIPGFGCLPRPECGICPVGYFLGEYESESVCIPVGIPDLYTLTDCLEGMTLDPENACCELPPDTYEPVCPIGFVFDPASGMCVAGHEVQCTSLMIYISPCEGVTPVTPICTNPGQYTNPASCAAANCRWVERSAAPGYCTYP